MHSTLRHSLKHPITQVLTLLLLWGSACTAARAQAMPTATAPGAYIAVGGTYSYFNIPYGQQHMGGPGIFVDLNIRRQLGLEAEGRWINRPQIDDVHESTYLIGPRYQFYRRSFAPYVKVLVGAGNFTFPYNYEQSQNFVIAPGGGLDWAITNNIKLRLIDFEYQDWTHFAYGSYNPYGISAGISVRVFNGTRGGFRHRLAN